MNRNTVPLRGSDLPRISLPMYPKSDAQTAREAFLRKGLIWMGGMLICAAIVVISAFAYLNVRIG